MMQCISMIGSALSQLANVMTALDLTDTGPNESLSARMHRQRNPDHCERAFLDDVSDAKALLAEIEGKT